MSESGFEESLYRLCKEGQQREAAALALRLTDALLREGDHAVMNSHFETLRPESLSAEAIIALMVFTRFEPDLMPARSAFFDESVRAMRGRGDVESADDLDVFR